MDFAPSSFALIKNSSKFSHWHNPDSIASRLGLWNTVPGDGLFWTNELSFSKFSQFSSKLSLVWLVFRWMIFLVPNSALGEQWFNRYRTTLNSLWSIWKRLYKKICCAIGYYIISYVKCPLKRVSLQLEASFRSRKSKKGAAHCLSR